MRAAWFEKFGDAADVLTVGDLETPVAGPGEVLVRLHTSGVNPSDVKKRAGAFPQLLDDGPVVPHSDGAGIIESVGKDVCDRQPGDRVWVYQAQYGRRFGTAAQYVAIDARRTALLPTNADYQVGACLGIPAMTAHRCVHSDGSPEGQSVLVTGGVGRVGHYAIQWAVAAGARVVATASNDVDAAACFEAGASGVVNHREQDWSAPALQANDGKRFDRVIDVEFGQNLDQVLQLVRTGGRIVTYSSSRVPEPQLPFLRMLYMDLTVQFVLVYAMPETAKQHALRDIEDALHHERLQHRIAATFDLAEIAAAHETVEKGGNRGCVVITIP